MAEEIKKEIINNIYTLLSASIMKPLSYKRRSRGFISELMFREKCVKEKKHYLEGGWIFFRGDSLKVNKEAVYITTSFSKPDLYTDFYSELSKCPSIKRLFFFIIKPFKQWNKIKIVAAGNTVEILEPSFDTYEFTGVKFVKCEIKEFTDLFPILKNSRYYKTAEKPMEMLNYLSKFGEQDLAELYCSRYVIDYLMKGRDQSYGMDFDGIINENGRYFVVETKEKDPGPSDRKGIPKEKWFFGWDSIRLVWYLYLVKTTNLGCYSVVLEIDNRVDRKPIDWKRAEILELCKSIHYGNAMTGGVGMGGSAGSTTIAPYLAFKSF